MRLAAPSLHYIIADNSKDLFFDQSLQPTKCVPSPDFSLDQC